VPTVNKVQEERGPYRTTAVFFGIYRHSVYYYGPEYATVKLLG